MFQYERITQTLSSAKNRNTSRNAVETAIIAGETDFRYKNLRFMDFRLHGRRLKKNVMAA